MLRSIGKLVTNREICPCFAAIIAPGDIPHPGIQPICRQVAPGVIVDSSVRKLCQCRFSGTRDRERIAGVPGSATVITVDRIGIVLRPILLIVPLTIKPRRTDQPAFILTVLKSNSGFVHTHGRYISMDIRMDRNVFLHPRFAMITAPEHMKRRRRVPLFGKDQNISCVLIHNSSTTIQSRTNRNFLSPGFSTIFTSATPYLAPSPYSHNRAVFCYNNVWQAFVGKYLLDFYHRLPIVPERVYIMLSHPGRRNNS